MEKSIGVTFREALGRVYRFAPPLHGLYRRVLHLMSHGEIGQERGKQIIDLIEAEMRARGDDPDKIEI